MNSPAVNEMADRLDRLVDHMANEWDMNYAEAVGVLSMKIHTLNQQAIDEEEN